MQRSITKLVLTAGMLILAFGAYGQEAAAGGQVPKELLQYVRDAQKAGAKEAQIQQNAVTAGWPADVVNAAIQEALHAGVDSTAKPAAPVKTADVPVDKPAADHPTEAAATEPKPSPPATAASGATAPAPADPNAAAPAPAGKIPPVIDRGVPDEYQIGAGDELQISVWKEPDASVPSVVVRPDGKISMPMLKEVSVIGQTPIQAEKSITDQLKNYITAADVTVIVKAINSKKIYIVGGVKKEGPIAYTYRMTVLQAISEAGGLTDYAKKKRIYVLRHENGRDYRFPFDYDAVLRGERMELNVPLMPGDTLVVPK